MQRCAGRTISTAQPAGQDLFELRPAQRGAVREVVAVSGGTGFHALRSSTIRHYVRRITCDISLACTLTAAGHLLQRLRSTFGGLVGSAFASLGTSGVQWENIVEKIIIPAGVNEQKTMGVVFMAPVLFAIGILWLMNSTIAHYTGVDLFGTANKSDG